MEKQNNKEKDNKDIFANIFMAIGLFFFGLGIIGMVGYLMYEQWLVSTTTLPRFILKQVWMILLVSTIMHLIFKWKHNQIEAKYAKLELEERGLKNE